MQTTHLAPVEAFYHPLNSQRREIRVLELHPGLGNDDIHGSLHVTLVLWTITLVFRGFLEELNEARKFLYEDEESSDFDVDKILEYLHKVTEIYLECLVWVNIFIVNQIRELDDTGADFYQVQMLELTNTVLGIIETAETVSRIIPNIAEEAAAKGHDDVLATTHIISNTTAPLRSILETAIESRDRDELADEMQNGTSTSIQRRPTSESETHCKSQHSTMMPFEAVSYCWGPLSAQARIYIDGSELPVAVSAVEVPHRLRLKDKSRMLWIDAICINQQDTTEKNNQVPLMGDIYRSAERTLVWLGQDSATEPGWHSDEVSLEICQLASDLIMGSHGPEEFFERYRTFKLDGGASHSDTKLRTDADKDWQSIILEAHALSRVFERRWFTRLWTYQELVNSKQLICYLGNSSIEWSRLRAIADHVLRYPEFMAAYVMYGRNASRPSTVAEYPTLLETINRIRYHEHNHRLGSTGVTLAQLAALSRNLGASDLRDKIFALLSMTMWAKRGAPLPPGIFPDYNKPLIDCMCDATKVMIEESESLAVLEQKSADVGYTEVVEGQGSFWPSWCPRWDKTGHGNPADFLDTGFNACDGLKLDVQLLGASSSSHVLPLRGFGADLIEGCTAFNVLDSPDQSLDDVLEQIQAHLRASFHLQPREWPSNKALLEMFHSKGARTPENYIFVIEQNMKESSFFITQQGRVGLGPKRLEKGDILAVLFGGKILHLLRRRGDQYIFVGPCYVDKSMHGEIAKEWGDSNGDSQIFEII